MKKLLLTLLLLCNNVFAEKLTIIVPFAAGTTPDIQCRHIMEAYDGLYNSSSAIINMPGADQLIGYRHFTTMTDNGFYCSGNGVMGVSQKINLNFTLSPDLVKPVAMTSTFGYFIYASTGNSLDEIIKDSRRTGRKITVGAISQHASKLITVILDEQKVPYEVIAYKKPADSLPSLTDKQLDIYIDGGTLKPVLDSMKEVKEIAHISPKNVSKSENLYKRNDNVKYLIAHTVIYVNNSVSDEEVRELNKRFNSIMQRPETVEFMKSRFPFHTINNSTIKEIEVYSTKLKHYMNHVYN